jgi:hypothetical protein
MGTHNALYVRRQGEDDTVRTAILSLYPNAEIQGLPDFIGGVFTADDLEPPEQQLAELSARLATDVIWISSQTTAESFIFHHWLAGEQLRALWYGCGYEGAWDRADGQPEPWEAETLWSQDALEASLESAETESERRNLERIWSEKTIRQGQTDPSVNSEEVLPDVMGYYGLFFENVQSAKSQSAPVTTTTKLQRRSGCLVALLFLIAIGVLAVFRVIRLWR